MANFKSSFELMSKMEFNNPNNCLHRNKGENGLTFWGIYESANPSWSGWNMVRNTLSSFGDIKAASSRLYNDEWLKGKVMQFYKTNYWDKLKLDRVDSQKIADEMFCFGVNAGVGTSARIAQRVVGVDADGIIGDGSLEAINSFDESEFDTRFDELEIEYYNKIIKNKPSLNVFRKGWTTRAYQV